MAVTKLPYSLWQTYTITNSHYNGLSLLTTTNKKNMSFLFVLTSIVCIQNPTQFVYNTEQYKFAQVILVMTDVCICEWLLTVQKQHLSCTASYQHKTLQCRHYYNFFVQCTCWNFSHQLSNYLMVCVTGVNKTYSSILISSVLKLHMQQSAVCLCFL
jgi:hypothetical protein